MNLDENPASLSSFTRCALDINPAVYSVLINPWTYLCVLFTGEIGCYLTEARRFLRADMAPGAPISRTTFPSVGY